MPDEKPQMDGLLAFIQLNAPETDDELADVLGDYAAKLRDSTRGGGHHLLNDTEQLLKVSLPPKLLAREEKWIANRLRLASSAVDYARWCLGFDGVPFPDDVEAADALDEWCQKQLEPEPRFLTRSTPEQSEVLQRALRSLRPRSNVRNPEKTEEEHQLLAFEHAVRALRDGAASLAERLGCERNEAARWILAGHAPEHACVGAIATHSMHGANTVAMTLNADVVTPEEARTLYRRMRKLASPPDGELSVFLNPISGNMGGTWKERLDRWNEAHPLRQYKNIASFKAAAWRTKRREGQEPR